MELIREPLDVDFYIQSRPLTEQEKREVSEFIRSQKQDAVRSNPAVSVRSLSTLRRKKVIA
jgi:hypothetical protein